MSDGEPLDLDEAAMEEALREAEAIAEELQEDQEQPGADSTEDSEAANKAAEELAASYIKQAAEEPKVEDPTPQEEVVKPQTAELDANSPPTEGEIQAEETKQETPAPSTTA